MTRWIQRDLNQFLMVGASRQEDTNDVTLEGQRDLLCSWLFVVDIRQGHRDSRPPLVQIGVWRNEEGGHGEEGRTFSLEAGAERRYVLKRNTWDGGDVHPRPSRQDPAAGAWFAWVGYIMSLTTPDPPRVCLLPPRTSFMVHPSFAAHFCGGRVIGWLKVLSRHECKGIQCPAENGGTLCWREDATGETGMGTRVKLRGQGGRGIYALWSSIFPEVAGVVSIEKPSRIEHRLPPPPPPAILSPGCASARRAAEAMAMHPHHPPAIGRRVAENARSVVKLRIPPPAPRA
jgi:hypothetical protein